MRSTTSKATIQAQARRLDRRRSLQRDVAEVVKWLLDQNDVIRIKIDSSCCHMIKELKNFLHFSFRLDSEQTESGGETVKIWYRRGGADCLVMDMHYQKGAVRECQPDVFDESRDWLLVMNKIINKRHGIFADINLRVRRETRKLGLL